jgi:hypothetical protein
LLIIATFAFSYPLVLSDTSNICICAFTVVAPGVRFNAFAIFADEDDRLGRGRHRNRKTTRVYCMILLLTSRCGSCGLLRHDHEEMAS